MTTREREKDAQRRLLDRAATKWGRRYRDAVARDMAAMRAEYERTGAYPQLPPGSTQSMAALYQEMAVDMFEGFGLRILGQAKHLGIVLETKNLAELFLRWAAEYVAQEMIRRRIVSVMETTRNQIVTLIEQGYAAGEGQDAIAKRINDAIPTISRWRGAMIARTETHGAANTASWRSASETGLQLKKEWLASEDARTRDFGQADGEVDMWSHRDMDGVTVAKDEKFTVPNKFGGSEKLMFPGDPAGSAGNIINCRCTTAYVAEGFGETSPAAQSAVIGSPVNADEYRTFVPPKNVREMEEFITSRGIADRAELKGFNVKNTGAALEYFEETSRRFGLDPIIGIGPSTRFGFRKVRGAVAAVFHATDRNNGRKAVFHMPTTFGSDAEAAKAQAVAIRNAAAYKKSFDAAKGNVAPAVRRIMDEMDAKGDAWGWTYGATFDAPEYRRSTVYHEFGHIIHLQNTANPQASDDINDFLRVHRPRQEGWHMLLSKYSGTNDREYVAEAFAIYMQEPDQHYRIHPELLKVFRRHDREPR